MNAPSIHRYQPYRGTDATCGEHAFMGGMRRLASIAPTQNQSRGIYRARVISLARPGPASVLHCRGTPRLFYDRTAGGRCIGIQRRRLVAFPPRRRAATFITQIVRTVMAARRHLVNQPRRQAIADLTHPNIPSSGVTFHAQEHEPKGVGSAQEHVGEFQDVDHC
jgi:hypothetical protein